MFNLSYNAFSNNTVEYHVPAAPYDSMLGVTYWYYNGPYLTQFNIVIMY